MQPIHFTESIQYECNAGASPERQEPAAMMSVFSPNAQHFRSSKTGSELPDYLNPMQVRNFPKSRGISERNPHRFCLEREHISNVLCWFMKSFRENYSTGTIPRHILFPSADKYDGNNHKSQFVQNALEDFFCPPGLRITLQMLINGASLRRLTYVN
eukprot:2899488-Amphidinium_carterae.3